MSHYIAAGTEREQRAKECGARLKQLRVKRSVSSRSLAAATGISRTQILHYEQGRNIPTLTSAMKISDALNDRSFVDMVKACRMASCRRCRREFFVNHARPPMFCSEACRSSYRTGDRVVEQRRVRVLSGELRLYRKAVDAMCRQCPDGESGCCRLADCPLRSISPLPYATESEIYRVAVASTKQAAKIL